MQREEDSFRGGQLRGGVGNKYCDTSSPCCFRASPAAGSNGAAHVHTQLRVQVLERRVHRQLGPDDGRVLRAGEHRHRRHHLHPRGVRLLRVRAAHSAWRGGGVADDATPPPPARQGTRADTALCASGTFRATAEYFRLCGCLDLPLTRPKHGSVSRSASCWCRAPCTGTNFHLLQLFHSIITPGLGSNLWFMIYGSQENSVPGESCKKYKKSSPQIRYSAQNPQ